MELFNIKSYLKTYLRAHMFMYIAILNKVHFFIVDFKKLKERDRK